MKFGLHLCNSRPLFLSVAIAALCSVGCAGPSGGEGGHAGSGGAPSTGGLPTGGGGEDGSGGTGGTSSGSGGQSTGSGGRTAGTGGSATGGTTLSAGSGGATTGSGGTQAGGSGGLGGSGGVTLRASGGAGAGGVASGGARTGGNGAGGVGSGGVAAGGARAGGAGGSGGTTSSPGGSTGSCGSATLNQHPFGCKLAWGIADPGGSSLANYSYLQFVSSWVDSSISASGTYTSCGGCNWLTSKVASTNLIPVYYAYIIGFLGHANGIVDGNQSGSKKLTTDGAALIKANYSTIINAYAWYAKQTAKAWPSKPLVWLLEGDFVQYADSGQSSPLSYADLGKLAGDITCAIKSNMPNAVVAIDHSSWNHDDVTNSYWGAMQNVSYDMVWTTGVGDNNGYIASGTTSKTYNAATATYSYLHSLTGRTILVDTSAGASAAGDSWSTAGATQLDARIAEGVIAANITGTPPSGLQGNITGLSSLNAIPSCP